MGKNPTLDAVKQRRRFIAGNEPDKSDESDMEIIEPGPQGTPRQAIEDLEREEEAELLDSDSDPEVYEDDEEAQDATLRMSEFEDEEESDESAMTDLDEEDEDVMAAAVDPAVVRQVKARGRPTSITERAMLRASRLKNSKKV